MFECLNDFCIFNFKKDCYLGRIEINNKGACANCIMAKIPSDTLQKFKNITTENQDLMVKLPI